MTSPIEPINQNIVVEIEKQEETTESGLLVAHSEGEKTESVSRRGTVIAVSPDIKDPRVKTGDRVLVAKWESQIAVVLGKPFIVIDHKYILGKIS